MDEQIAALEEQVLSLQAKQIPADVPESARARLQLLFLEGVFLVMCTYI